MFGKRKNQRLEDEEQRPPTVLALTASQSDRDLLQRIFEKAGWKMLPADGLDEALQIASAKPVPIVVLDRDHPGFDWREAIGMFPDSCVILASSVADDYLLDEVIHCGGYDILPKPFRDHEVMHTVRFAWVAISKRTPLTRSLPFAPRRE